ncbi:MAG: SGNH hydrolase domain-containing protein, partial [Oceanobacter sp.]
LAWVTWRWVERPFRFGGLRKYSTPVLITALLLVSTFGGYVWLNQGLIERSSVRALSFMTQDLVFELPEDHSSWCAAQSQWASDAICFLHESTTHPTSALIGDSHAQALFPGLATALEEQEGNLVVVGAAGCPPLLDVYSSDTSKSDQRSCLDKMTPAIEAVVKDPTINRVYLTGRGALYVSGDGFGSYRDSYNGDWTLRFISENAGDLKNPEAYQAGLQLTVKTLLEAGKKVLFLHDVPELGFDPRTCMPDRPFAPAGSQRWPCGVGKTVFLNRYANFEQLVDEVLEDFPEVTQVHLSEALCDDRFCIGALPDMLLYRDDDHLSERGSHWVIRRLQDSGVL